MSAKRKRQAAAKKARKAAHYAQAKGKSPYALKQRVKDRPGSPLREVDSDDTE